MTHFKSRFSFFQAILLPIVFIAFCLGLTIVLCFVSIQEINEGVVFYKTPIWTIPMFGLLGFYYVYYFLKTFKTYRFSNKGIRVTNVFNKEFISWKQLKRIDLIGKELESFLWVHMFQDCLSFKIKNRKQLNLFSKYYSNMPEMRRLIYYVNNQLNNNSDINIYEYNINFKSQSINSKDSSDYTSYKRPALFTFNGVMVTFSLVFFFFLMLTLFKNLFAFLYIGFLFGMVIWSFSRDLYYFKINKTTLVIKHHFWFWINKKFVVDNMYQVNLESPYKRSNALRIINKDFKMFLFGATSLRDKHWRAIRENLRNKSVEVEDELFFE